MYIAQFISLFFYLGIALCINFLLISIIFRAIIQTIKLIFLLFFFLVSLFEGPGIVWSTMPGFLTKKAPAVLAGAFAYNVSSRASN